jgi:hypothetical protein
MKTAPLRRGLRKTGKLYLREKLWRLFPFCVARKRMKDLPYKRWKSKSIIGLELQAGKTWAGRDLGKSNHVFTSPVNFSARFSCPAHPRIDAKTWTGYTLTN